MRLTVVATMLLVLTAGLLATPSGQALDRELVDRAHAIDQSVPAVHFLMELGTDLGRTEPLLLAFMLTAGFGTEVARGTVKIAILSVGANQLATDAIKWLTNRPRPDGGENKRSNTSFPSGHASGIVGLAWIVAHRHKRLASLAWTLAIWVSVSRVFLERHYVSDVLAGALVGILFAVIALRFEDRIANWVWARR